MHQVIRHRRRSCRAATLFLLGLLPVTTVAAQPASSPSSARVALVPLDDRPQCLQDLVLLGEVADTQVVTPPRVVLGRFLKTGDGGAIARWLDDLDLTTLDAVVVSTDMLAYGGLVGSRVARVFEADARQRLEALARLKQRRPDLRVYAFSTILGPAPAKEVDSGAWRQIRARNRAINLLLVDLAARGAVDYLVFGLDVTTSSGMDEADRAAIAEAIGKADLTDRAAIQVGADEFAMLLLARALANRFNYYPAVQVVYSSTAARDAVMPFDERPLKDAVAAHVATAGTRLDERGGLQLFVYASRHETPDQADAFASRIAQAVASGGRVVVTDIDPKGAAPGAWLPFAEGLRTRALLPRLFGYASWNTAGSTIGTALPHGLLFALAVDKVGPALPAARLRVAQAQVRFLLHRLINDFLYHGIVRGQTTEDLVGPRGMNPLRLDDSGRGSVEKHVVGELKLLAESLAADFTRQPWRLPGPAGQRSTVGLTVKEIDGFELTLPWGRMSEAEIQFSLIARPAETAPRPPPPRVLR